MIRTFFKPLKNEYRKGLVVFSIGIGIFVKTVFIIMDLLLFLTLIFFEITFLTFFIWWPLVTFLILFIQAPF